MKKLILACALAAMLCGLAACSGQAEQPGQGEQPPAKAAELGSIWMKGSGNQTGDWFAVDEDEWAVNFSCLVDPEYEDINIMFDIYVYPKGETWAYVEYIDATRVARGFSGKMTDCGGTRPIDTGAGEYYVRVEAAGIQCWKIGIVPPRGWETC